MNLSFSTPAGAPQLPTSEQQRIDELLAPLQTVAASRLDHELGARLAGVVPLAHCLAVFSDFGATGLDAEGQRLHGTMPADLQGVYANLIVGRDPLLARAGQEWRPLVAAVPDHARWLRGNTRNPETLITWLQRNAQPGGEALAVIPARGWLSQGGVYAFAPAALDDAQVFALFYAAQRIAVALELRVRPFIADLLALRFTPREADVLRAGLRGASDDEIAARLGLSIDAIRYYFKKFKHRVPPTIGHLKPRELARVLHHLGKL